MGTIDTAFKAAFRDYVTDGVSASGARSTPKSDCRALGSTIEGYFAAPWTLSANATAVASLPAIPTGGIFRVAGVDGAANQFGLVESYGGIPGVQLRRANGTAASRSAIALNDVIGTWDVTGYHSGGSFTTTPRAQMRAVATENWTSTAQGAKTVFAVTPTGGTSTADVAWLDQDGSLRVKGALGYQTGVGTGSTVTQATSKSTGVTLNALSGQITLSATGTTSYAALTTFVLTNSTVAATDTVSVSHVSGGTAGAYWFGTQVGAGQVRISVFSYASLAEAIVIQFNVIKGATS